MFDTIHRYTNLLSLHVQVGSVHRKNGVTLLRTLVALKMFLASPFAYMYTKAIHTCLSVSAVAAAAVRR